MERKERRHHPDREWLRTDSPRRPSESPVPAAGNMKGSNARVSD